MQEHRMTPLQEGVTVVITDGPLGVLSPDGHLDDDVVLRPDDRATYRGSHPGMPDWHDLTVERDGVLYECLAHSAQFAPQR